MKKETQIIVTIANRWLRISILDILSKCDWAYERIDDLQFLYQELAQSQATVLLIDPFGYGLPYKTVLERLCQLQPQLPKVVLLPCELSTLTRPLALDPMIIPVVTDQAQERLGDAIMQANALYHSQLVQGNDEGDQLMAEKKDTLFNQTLNRRSFLKGATAAAALTGVAVAGPGNMVVTALAEGSGKQTAPPEEKVILNCCRTACTQHCPLEFIVRDGKIVRTKAAKLTEGMDDGRICAKGSAWQHRIYSDKRIKHPYKRIGERGSGEWEQITWEEAISTTAAKLNEIRAQYGGGAIAAGTEGGNLAPSTGASYARWAAVVGASKLGCNDDQMYIQCIPYNVGGVIDYENAKNIVLIGTNMPASKLQEYRVISDAVNNNGGKLIVIDPNFTTTASKASIHAPIRPGTDAALAMALTNYIEQNKLTQDDYLKEMTELPFLVKASDGLFLRRSDLNGGEGAGTPEDDIVVWDADANQYGYSREVVNPELRGSFEINGIKVNPAYQLLLNRIAPFTVEKASKLCDLPVSMIEEIARACANNSAIYFGMGIDHWKGGLGAVMAVFALQMVTGGLKLLPKASAPSIYWPLEGFALDEVDHPKLAPYELSPWMILPLVESGKCELEGGKIIEQPIKALAFLTGGRGNGYPDHNRTIEVFKKVDFVVAADIFWNDNVEYADIVLPVATQMEVDDIMSTGMYLLSCQKAVDPLYDSKPDFEIAKLLAEGMGEGKWFEGFEVGDILDITLRGNPTYNQMGLTYDQVKQAGCIPFADAYAPPGFYTGSGKAVLYLEKPVPMKDYGQTFDVEKVRLPHFDPPVEAWTETIDEYAKNPLADKYPLNYLTGPRRYRTHGNFSFTTILRELDKEPCVHVNPKDAEARGIKDGDYVKLYNDRGHVIARCIFNNGMRPGVVDMDRGWQHGQYLDKESHFNSLTHMTMEPACYNHMLYDVLCEMEKA